MSHEERTRYLPGFREAVKALMGPKAGAWSTTYTDEAGREQALRQAYQAGRLDGMAEALRLAAPTAPEAPEEPWETLDEAWERLGLFHAVSTPPALISGLVSPPVAPLAIPARVWMVREARRTLDVSLAEATEWVDGLLGGAE